MNDLKRLRGLFTLLGDAVEHGTSAVERVHLGTAARPFGILEAIPPTAPVARIVHVVHDGIASGVYSTIRATNRLVGVAANLAIDAAEAGLDEAPLDGAADAASGEGEDPVTPTPPPAKVLL
jgi:hypothetical protein